MIHKEIVIVGGGPIGLTTALILLDHGLKVTLFDSGDSKANDGRVLALSYASIELLKEHGIVTDELATPINEVHISHKGLGVSKIVARELDLDTLGYTIKYTDICKILANKVLAHKNFEFMSAVVDDIIHDKEYASVFYRCKGLINHLTAGLLIMAEGGNIKIAGAQYEFYDYCQIAVIAEIATESKHNGIAYERFGNDGGLVLLPHFDRYVLVWSLSNDMVKNQPLDKNILQKKLQALPFMERFGNFMVQDRIHQFPLKLRCVKKRVLNNLVLIGNSAQTVHPVSAQGMNIGLRDAKILSDVILKAESYKDGTTKFCLEELQKYDDLRKYDSKIAIGFTHHLAKFIDMDNPLINHIRGAGIIALSNCKTLQDKIANSLIFGN